MYFARDCNARTPDTFVMTVHGAEFKSSSDSNFSRFKKFVSVCLPACLFVCVVFIIIIIL